MKLQGLYTAVVTPFKDNQIDELGLQKNLSYQSEQGVDGIIVLGSTGEASTLSNSEKETVIKIAKNSFKTGTLIVGTGSYSTTTTIENSLKAADLGADAVLIVVPYYNKPTQKGIIKHYETIAEALSIPIILYNVPSRCSVNMDVSSVITLSQHPNIIGIKECGATLQPLTEMVYKIKQERPDFAILTGDDIQLFSAMLLGADGIISVISNLIPDKVKLLIDYLKHYKIEDARQLYFQLLPFINAAFLETNPIPIKEAMNYCGFAAGDCRLPLTTIEENHRRTLVDVIEKLPLAIHI